MHCAVVQPAVVAVFRTLRHVILQSADWLEGYEYNQELEWRMCPGQYYRSITALQFTSPPLSDGFTLDPTLPPDTLSIIPHTPAAKQHLPLSPYTSHPQIVRCIRLQC